MINIVKMSLIKYNNGTAKCAQKKSIGYEKTSQKFIFHGPAYPKETSRQCTTSTFTEAVHHQEVLGGTGSSILVFDH